MQKLLKVSAVVAVALTMASRANAQQILSFDEMAPNPQQPPILGSVVCANTSGLRFDSNHFHVIGPNFVPDFSSSGSTHIGYESGRGFPITMSRVGSGTFSLSALDAGEFYASATVHPDFPDAEWITITGTRADNTTVTHNIFLDGIRDGVGGVADFQHFVLPNTFVNLRSVVFTGWRTGNLDGGIALDNLQYTLSPAETLPACQFFEATSDIPVVQFVTPAAGLVSGTVNIQATASDNVGVTSVTFLLDGVALGPADTTAPYTFSWNTTTVADGPHALTAEARDASNNVGTATVSVTVQNGSGGGTDPHYLEFDGVDDYVQVADTNAMSFGTGTADRPLTFEMWLRTDALGKHQLIGKWGESTNQEYRLQIAAGSIRLDIKDQSANAIVSVFTSSLPPITGSWHHLAVTYDGRGGATAADGVTIYIDGAALGVWRINNGAYVAMENLAAPVEIGREGPQWNQYDGSLDEIRVWSVARTQIQIQAAMMAELTGTETGLVGYWRFNEGTGLVADDASPGTSVGTLFNGPQWMTGGPLTPDTVPPVISNVATSNLTATGVTITFTTNESTTGWVSYTATGACPCTDVFSPAVGTSHNITLSGLTPDTLYRYQAMARDSANNAQASTAATFRTLVQSSDTIAPTVSITSPAAGTVVGTVSVQASASDNVGVVSVQFFLDGVAVGAADTTSPYTYSWDTTTVADGVHPLSAQARDAANNVGTAVSVNVLVQNTPTSTSPHYLDFDGVDDYLSVADAAPLSFGTGGADLPMTIEMWMRTDAIGKHQLIGKWGESSNQEYRVQIAQGTIRVDLRDQSANAMASAFTKGLPAGMVGAWHHLAVVYDGRGGRNAANGITIYIDGASMSMTRINDASYVAMEDLAAPVEIGREGPQWNQYNGALDEMRLWNVARTQSQIQSGMPIELTGTESGLVAYWRFNESSGATTGDDSPFTHVATLLGGVARLAGGPLAPDTTAPTISNIATANLTSSGVTISFATNELTTGWVSYSATGACPCTDVFSAATGTSHSITLTGLTADTLYTYWAKARDAANNQQTSTARTFRTLVPSADTTPPTVSITSPAAGSVVGTVSIQASASDNVGVVSVQFRVDGVAIGAADTTAPYSVSWNTTTVADGPHTITADARDAANNVSTASVAVAVQNTPTTTSPHYLDFDGVDDYITVADAPQLSFGTGGADLPMTIEMWMRTDALGKHQLIGKWGESSNQEYRVQIAQGTIRVDLRDQSANAMASVFTNGLPAGMIGAWHHVAVVYDGRGGATAADGITVYIDGLPLAGTRMTDPAYVAMESLAAPVEIGREGPFWNQYNGALDEVRLWNVARTQSQIQAGMPFELTGAESGLVGYWRFNEGAGGIAADSSPWGQPATLTISPAWLAGGHQ